MSEVEVGQPIRCRVSHRDRVHVIASSASIGVGVAFDGDAFSPEQTIFMSPQTARKLRKQLKRAIRRAEGK